MDVNPLETVDNLQEEEQNAAEAAKEKQKNRLNSYVAVMVAILATFMGISKVKDDNIVQAMEQAQAKSIDSWAWYQAKKTRLLFAQATLDTFEVQQATASPTLRPTIEEKSSRYRHEIEKQTTELADVEKEATGHDKEYDRLNIHDDQFDFSDALLAIAISLFALTALTQKRWLFLLALVPTVFGVVYGLAGLFNLSLHSDFLAKLLGA
jgi:hypothetical protein